MICRGTTRAVVMLALLSITQFTWSTEPTRRHSQAERIRLTPPANSLKFAIRDPAGRALVGPATRPQPASQSVSLRRDATRQPNIPGTVRLINQANDSIQPVNHESIEISPRQAAVLISQLGDSSAREALDALRSISDDVDDLDIADILDGTRGADTAPKTLSPNANDVQAILERLNREKVTRESPSDANRAEQRKQELESLLKTVEEEDQRPKKEADLEEDDMDDAAEPGIEDQYTEPVSPQSIYATNTNYEQIPWTMGDMFDENEKTWDEQCREQQMCQQMWACAGGRCMSPCDRWKRNLRRTYELTYGECPNSMATPLLSGFLIEPLLGYGFFGAPVGLAAGPGCGCEQCGHGIIPGSGGGLLGGGRLRAGGGLLRRGLFKGLVNKVRCGGSCTSGCTSCGACGGNESSCTSCTCGG